MIIKTTNKNFYYKFSNSIIKKANIKKQYMYLFVNWLESLIILVDILQLKLTDLQGLNNVQILEKIFKEDTVRRLISYLLWKILLRKFKEIKYCVD